jgi:hypothetical protein
LEKNHHHLQVFGAASLLVVLDAATPRSGIWEEYYLEFMININTIIDYFFWQYFSRNW